MNTSKPTGCSGDNDFWELLPWYLNGSLDPAQHRRMALHMEMCETCRAEVTIQRELAATVMAADIVVPDSNSAYRALADRIDGTKRRRGATQGLRGVIDRFIAQKFRTERPFVPALMTAAAISMVIGVGLLVQDRPQVSPEVEYRTLTAASRSGSKDVRHARVVFVPQLSREEIHQAVAEIDARLISGPSERSVYVIAFEETSASRDEIVAAIDSLREDSRIIFAEPAVFAPDATVVK